EAYGTQACLIGFSTHTGTVTAASNWDEPAQRKRVRPSLAGSYERLFHDVGIGQFLLRLADAATKEALSTPRLERAIGVIYRPQHSRRGDRAGSDASADSDCGSCLGTRCRGGHHHGRLDRRITDRVLHRASMGIAACEKADVDGAGEAASPLYSEASLLERRTAASRDSDGCHQLRPRAVHRDELAELWARDCTWPDTVRI